MNIAYLWTYYKMWWKFNWKKLRQHIPSTSIGGKNFYLSRKAYDRYVLNEIWEEDCYFFTDLPSSLTYPIVDIGGHLGGFALKASDHWPNQVIHSFEPMPENYFLFNANLKLNKGKNIYSYNSAISVKNGFLNLNIHKENPAGHSIFAVPGGQSIKVPTLSLKDFLEKSGIKKLSLLKLDCEGSEYPILLNTPIKTLNNIEHILCEIHPIAEYSSNTLEDYLARGGFQKVKSLPGYFEGQYTAWFQNQNSI